MKEVTGQEESNHTKTDLILLSEMQRYSMHTGTNTEESAGSMAVIAINAIQNIVKKE